jgi:hypothetical protein
VTGIGEGDDTGAGAHLGVCLDLLIGPLELAGYRLQTIDEVCLIVLSEGCPFQIKGNFPAGGNGAKEELAELLSQILGNVIDIGEPTLLAGATPERICLDLRFKEGDNVIRGEIIQLSLSLQVLSSPSNPNLSDILAIRKTSDDRTDPHHGRLLHGGTVVPFLAAVDPDGLVQSKAARMIRVATHEPDQARGFGGEV